LPLTIVTLFCFGYAFAQSKAYQASHPPATNKATGTNSGAAESIKQLDDPSANKLDTVETPAIDDVNASSSATSPANNHGNSNEDNQNNKYTSPGLDKRVNNLLNNQH
jgi:hypothetical protein